MTSSNTETLPGKSLYGTPGFWISALAAVLPGLYLLLTSTTSTIEDIWPYDAKRLLQFLLLSILFALPLIDRSIRRELGNLWAAAPGWLTTALGGIAAWGVVAASWNARSAMHALNALADVALLGCLVLGVVVIAACRRVAGTVFDRIAVSLLILTGLVVGFQEVLGVLAALASGSEFNFRISLLHFSWPRFYNQVQSWIVPALAALPLLFARYRLAAVLCLLTLALQWFIILMTGARGSFVSLLAAFGFAALFLPAARGALLKWQAGGLLLGALLFAGAMFAFESGPADEMSTAAEPPKQVVRDADREAAGGQIGGGESSFFRQSVGRPLAHTSGRSWMWPIALNDIRSHPWFGIGPMGYACVSTAGFGHPHNFALQIAAEWGLPAAVAAAALFLVLLWIVTARVRAAGRDGVITGLLLTGILAASLHAGLSGVMVMPASQVTGLLLAGLLLGRLPADHRDPSAAWAVGTAAAGLVLALALTWLGADELNRMEERSARLPVQFSLYPRMWQDSKVCLLYPPSVIVED
ncbi:MAG: O-antigen ligase family protein [Gammaproteobacteria bacterium]|nr:O-antigen ligase family protein [Gammaproteobacteria bacterium]